MAHSFVSSVFHIVFSTKQRAQLIRADHQSRLWNYLAGIARNHGMQMLAVGGTQNHVHMLVVFPSDMALSDAVRTLKRTPADGCEKPTACLRGRKVTERSASAHPNSIGSSITSPISQPIIGRIRLSRSSWRCCRPQTSVSSQIAFSYDCAAPEGARASSVVIQRWSLPERSRRALG